MGWRSVLLGLLCVGLLAGCANPGASVGQRRQAILSMKEEVLDQLYTLKPDVEAQLISAPGYAVFSNANLNLVLASVGGGYGVLVDNDAGREVFMKLGELGIGFGAGLKDFRVVMVFHSREALARFEDYGFTFGAQADVAAKASGQGAAIGGEAVADNVTVYQFTQTGLSLQATIKGTKFWKDEQLNFATRDAALRD